MADHPTLPSRPTYRILFVCLGNICRSPTAEGVMRHMLRDAGLENDVDVESAGTGGWHIGHPPDERATSAAKRRGIALESRAQRFIADHFDDFDLILAMDRQNLADLQAIAPPPAERRAEVRLFSEFLPPGAPPDVPDPYYGGDAGFERVLDLVERGCEAIVDHLLGAESARRG
ncbi:MAG TPA: low molecular weight protein-tyrosine-phosphatase [Thermoanaerobaculia bacterium]|nr:low molecular weight protein-tyrosine-phosphatase [Thermoanaerobaculia bacterium]